MKNAGSKKRWMKALGAGALTAGVLDAIWIGGFAKKIYENEIPHLMAKTISAAPAAAFYVIHLAGTVYLVVRPDDHTRTTKQRLIDGAVLGGLAWGTFGMTNAAIMDRFPINVALIDTAWGAFLTATTAAVAGKVIYPKK